MLSHDDSVELFGWSEKAFCLTNGIRRSPDGKAFFAETRGGFGHPVILALREVGRGKGWALQVGKGGPASSFASLEQGLRTLLAWTMVDSYKLGGK